MPLLPEKFRDDDTACELFTEPSSTSLSGATERTLCILLGDFGYAGDFGGRRDFSGRWDSSVSVLGCVDCTESILFVKLGIVDGDGACTLTIFGSTGSGDDARGTPMPK